jgi:hypothetical protein
VGVVAVALTPIALEAVEVEERRLATVDGALALHTGHGGVLRSTREAVVRDRPLVRDAVAILVVAISEAKPRAVRVNITVPEDMLRKIETVAKKRGMSRSSFLVHAARNAITSKQNRNSL